MKRLLICVCILSANVGVMAALFDPPLENTSFEGDTSGWYTTHMMEGNHVDGDPGPVFTTVLNSAIAGAPVADGDNWGAIRSNNAIYSPIGVYSGPVSITVRLDTAKPFLNGYGNLAGYGPLEVSLYTGAQEYNNNDELVPGSPQVDHGLQDFDGSNLIGTQKFTLNGQSSRTIEATFSVTGAQTGELIWLQLRSASTNKEYMTAVDAIEVFEATEPLNPSPAADTKNVFPNAVLTWDASEAAGVTGYSVFMDKPGDPSLFLAATVSAAGPLEYDPSGDFELDFNQFRKWYVQAEPYSLLFDPNTPVMEFLTLNSVYPGILQHPDSWFGNIGDSPVLTVSAVNPHTLDSTGLEYQWRKDGSPVPGATSDTLTLSDVDVTDEGVYDCIVTITATSQGLDSEDARVRTRRMMGHWKLDEVSGGDPNIIPDSIQETHPGALTYDGVLSGAAASYAAGVDGTASGAFDFSADTNAAITIDNSATYLSEDNTDGFTVSAWLNLANKTAHMSAIHSFPGPDAFEPGFIVGTNYLNYQKDTSTFKMYTRRMMDDGQAGIDGYESFHRECFWLGGYLVPKFLGTDEWHLVTVTHDNATGMTTMYFDGLYHLQHLTDIQPAGIVDLVLGGNPAQFPSDSAYNGKLDDVRFYNYPLDAKAVAGLYVEQKPGEILCVGGLEEMDANGDCVIDLEDIKTLAIVWLGELRDTVFNHDDDTVVHWDFNQYGDPDVVLDQSGNDYHGLMTPGPNTLLADAFDWTVDGSGRTGQPGDIALYFKDTWYGDPNLAEFHKVQALNIDPNDHSTDPNDNIFLGGNPWTLNVWVKYDKFPGGPVNLAGFGDCEWDLEDAWIDVNDVVQVNDKDRYLLSDGEGGASRRTGWDTLHSNYSIGEITDSQWHMLTLIYDPTHLGGTLYSYLDGVYGRQKNYKALDDIDLADLHFIINSGGLISGFFTVTVDAGGNTVIVENSSQGVPFVGWIDDYRIFDTVLPQSEIDKLYQGYHCTASLTGDLNGDCKVDLLDFQRVASRWLDSALVPEFSIILNSTTFDGSEPTSDGNASGFRDQGTAEFDTVNGWTWATENDGGTHAGTLFAGIGYSIGDQEIRVGSELKSGYFEFGWGNASTQIALGQTFTLSTLADVTVTYDLSNSSGGMFLYIDDGSGTYNPVHAMTNATGQTYTFTPSGTTIRIAVVGNDGADSNGRLQSINVVQTQI